MAKLLANRLIQELDGNGAPYAGALLFTYEAGTSTKEPTYQDDGSTTAHANPIVLDAAGRIPAGVWLTEGQEYKLVLAPSDDTDPPVSPIWSLDNVSGINDIEAAGLDQWTVSALTPTYISGTQFSVPGDVTTDFHVGRRLKITDAGGTKYAYITATAYTTLTTVTVVVDASGSLSTPTSAVSLGVATSDNPSTPLLTDAFPIVSGSADKTKKVRLEVDGLTTATTRVLTVPDHNAMLPNFPAGFVVPYAGTTEPDGWLFAYGQAVSRTTYAALFTAISTVYGVGDGSTTFNLPDLRGRVVAGQDDMGGSSANRLTDQSGGLNGDTLGDTGGAETHTLTTAQVPALTVDLSGGTGAADSINAAKGGAVNNSVLTSTGSGGAHNNVQPTIILNYLIKT